MTIPSKQFRVLTACLIAVLVFILLLITVKDIGLTWDEPAYINASNSYMQWADLAFKDPRGAFSEAALTQFWKVNNEHPPVDKIWTGLVWRITRGLTDDLTAHRIGNMLLVALMAALLYLWIGKYYGQIAAFAAVAALLSMPRFFFHAHLAALDVPAAFSILLLTCLFWETRDRKGWAWGLLLGLAWGLALATKINAIFVPFPLFIWWLSFRRDRVLFLRFILMGIVAIPVFFAAWPWLYTHTFSHLGSYLAFVTVNHWQIGQFYLGQFYMPPPWHFGFVMVWAVIPITLTLLYFLGVIFNARARADKGLAWLLFLSALTPILAIAISKSIVYDNERMFMAAFPFLAGLAGAGFGLLLSKWQSISARWKSKVLRLAGAIMLAVVCLAPQLVTMVRLYPHYLSYYSEGVGGVAGASRIGLETTYWCESYAIALPILNEKAQSGDIIWADPWSHDVLFYYQSVGRLRSDLVIAVPPGAMPPLGFPSAMITSMDSADWYIFQHRQTTLGYRQSKDPIALTLERKLLVYEYAFDGVPILSLYASP